MAKILLTSIGVNAPNFEKHFIQLINKDIKDVKIVLISESKSETVSIYYLGMDIKGFVDMGLKLENITIYSLNEKSNIDLSIYDVVFVCGGNTYHYLDKIKKLKLDKQIIMHVNNNKLYIGESAGSIIAGPNIITANTKGEESDSNDINLKDLTGLNLVDFIIIPHYIIDKENEIKKLQKTTKYKIIPLTDSEILVVDE
jgi:dipeptidase E